MRKSLLSTLVILVSSTAFAGSKLTRGSKYFSSCKYKASTGSTAEYQVDKTVGVIEAQIVRGCPVTISYEFDVYAVVYQLGHLSAPTDVKGFCYYQLKDWDGEGTSTVTCTKK